jgi:hypothetical protein
LAGFPFDDDAVGCFYESDRQVKFVMLNGEDSASYEVSLLDATKFITSPRKIAFIESAQLFCAVVDLQPSPEEEIHNDPEE